MTPMGTPASFRRDLRVTSETKNLSVVRDFVSECATRSALPRTEMNKVILAVDEAVSNIMRHGYRGGPGEIELVVEADPKRIAITILDSGTKFDPDRVQDPDMGEHIRQGRKSGLGIFLMRQIMDEVSYSFREGVRNQLRLVKYLGPGGAEA